MQDNCLIYGHYRFSSKGRLVSSNRKWEAYSTIKGSSGIHGWFKILSFIQDHSNVSIPTLTVLSLPNYCLNFDMWDLASLWMLSLGLIFLDMSVLYVEGIRDTLRGKLRSPLMLWRWFELKDLHLLFSSCKHHSTVRSSRLTLHSLQSSSQP